MGWQGPRQRELVLQMGLKQAWLERMERERRAWGCMVQGWRKVQGPLAWVSKQQVMGLRRRGLL